MTVIITGSAIRVLARQTVVVESRLTNRDDLRVLRYLAQCGATISRCFAGMRRVPSYRRIQGWESFRQADHTAAAFQIGSNANHSVDPSRPCPSDDLRQFVREVRIVQVRMRVVETHELKLSLPQLSTQLPLSIQNFCWVARIRCTASNNRCAY